MRMTELAAMKCPSIKTLNTTVGIIARLEPLFTSRICSSIPARAVNRSYSGFTSKTIWFAACYPPEPDFLVRSQERPGEAVRTYEDSKALREGHEPQPVTNRWGVQWAPPKAGVD